MNFQRRICCTLVLIINRYNHSCKAQRFVSGSSIFRNTQSREILKQPKFIPIRTMSGVPIIMNDTRFFLEMDGFTAELKYRMGNNFIVLTHTKVPAELGGRGVGKALAQAALNYAIQNKLMIKVECEFVQSYIEKYEPNYLKYLLR